MSFSCSLRMPPSIDSAAKGYPSPKLPPACHTRSTPAIAPTTTEVLAPKTLTPDNFPETLPKSRAITLAILLVFANFVAMTAFGAGMGGGIQMASSLGVTESSEASWVAASYSLTAGAFVLMSGRLGSIYGHNRVLLFGAAWWITWSLINAFCTNFIAFNIARGMSGIGGAMVVPNAVAIIGVTFPPGAMRNRCLGLFGTGAPFGGWSGALLAGLLAEKVGFKWLFICMALLGTLVFGSLAIVLPKEIPLGKGETMDWIGSLLGISGFTLFNFVWNQAPKVGWDSPYQIALLVVSLLLFVAFGAWEQYVAAHPIMPLAIFRGPSFTSVMIVVIITFMSYGSFIWYTVAWQQEIWHWSVLGTAWGLSPLPIVATAGAFFAAWLVPRLAAQWILVIGLAAVLIPEILIATMPEEQLYWKQMFPAVVISCFCPDFVYIAAQIIACNSVGRRDQGVAGSLVGTMQLYATSIGLGFAGLVETHIKPHAGTAAGYQAALYFGMGLAAFVIVTTLVFVRMPKDNREGWQPEDTISERESRKLEGKLPA